MGRAGTLVLAVAGPPLYAYLHTSNKTAGIHA